MYVATTFVKSFVFLCFLSKQKLDAFLNAYVIFDLDWSREEEMVSVLGQDVVSGLRRKLVDYYSVLNHLLALGPVEKMYIPPAIDLSKGIIQNQNLFEERLSRDLHLTPRNEVLDIGCGRGRVAHHIAQYTGASITGINVDSEQLGFATRYAMYSKMSNLHFLFGDINKEFAFPDNTFDAAYHIQVFSYCKNLEATCKEVFRVLKPGGRFACLDYVLLDAFNPSNTSHVALLREVKPLLGALGSPTLQEYASAIEKAGFVLEVNTNASVDGLQAPLIEKADKFYTRLSKVLNILLWCKVLPRHFGVLFERLSRGGQSFVEADRKRLLTTTQYFVAVKPK